MIAFEDVHQNIVDRIAAHSFFSGESVLKDLGEKDNDREQALRQRGFCVTVAPVVKGATLSQSHSRVVVLAIIGVLVEVNPEVNPSVANKDIYAAVKAVVQAVLANQPADPRPVIGPPGNPSDNYQCDGDIITYSDLDEGLLGYLVLFNKNCVL